MLPALSYDSDIGLGFGALATWGLPQQGQVPYRLRVSGQFKMSLKDGSDGLEFPTHDHWFFADFPAALGTLRLSGGAFYLRQLNMGYYGLGNGSRAYDESVNRFNQFRMESPGIRIALRYPWFRQVSGFAGISVRHTSITLYPGSALEKDREAGRTGAGPRLIGTGSYFEEEVGGGFVYDSRDRELETRTGGFHEASLRGSPGFGEEQHYLAGNATWRWFHSFFGGRSVLAGRLIGDLFLGPTPFYRLAALGGLTPLGNAWGGQGVRGIPAGMFLGKAKLIGNLETRSRLYTTRLKNREFGIGAIVFLDGGRVWLEPFEHSPEDGDGLGINTGTGLGLRLSWGNILVIRADAAYSPQASEVSPGFPSSLYIQADQMF